MPRVGVLGKRNRFHEGGQSDDSSHAVINYATVRSGYSTALCWAPFLSFEVASDSNVMLLLSILARR